MTKEQRAEQLMAKGPVWLVRRVMELESFPNAPSVPTFRREGGETAKTLNDLAECAWKAASGDSSRLLHVASDDVPRLLAEIQRLRRNQNEERAPKGSFRS